MIRLLPFSYACRNLLRAPGRLARICAGSALVVLLVISAMMVNRGMRGVLSASGSDRNVVLVGVGSEESIQRSEVSARAAGIAETAVPGVLTVLGTPAASPEIHHMQSVVLPGGGAAQALFRGVTPAALLVYPRVRMLEGSFPQAGQVMVGRLAWRKLGVAEAALRPGAVLRADDQPLVVSGVFAAPGTVLESELWTTLGDLRVAARRDTLSCLVLRLRDAGDFGDAELFTRQRLDLELSAQRESDYYGRLSTFFRPMRAMTWITAGLVATGALLGGFNTLHAAFAARVRELATLQAIGFGRPALLLSLLQETTLCSLAGTLLAAGLSLALLDGLSVTFSIGSFTLQTDPPVLAAGLATGLVLGVLGCVPPALRCLRPPLPTALRLS